MMCMVVKRLILLLFVVLTRAAIQDTCEYVPSITITSKQKLKHIDKQTYEKPYGEDVVLHCSSKSNLNLSIKTDENLQTEKFNDTTILLNVNNPDTGRYEYICKDNITRCEDKLILKVIPLVLATSPSIRQTLDTTHKRPLYFVPKGEPCEIFCIAHKASLLNVYYIEGNRTRKLQSYPVNATTVHSAVVADYPVERTYYCSNKVSATKPVTVHVDYYPKTEDFQCVLYESQKIECTWTSFSKSNTFKLYYKQGENIALLCADNYKESKRGCTGHMPSKRYSRFSSLNNVEGIIVETCNEIFCDNQTIPYNGDAILKVNSVSDLKLLNTTENSVALSWRRPSGCILNEYCAYKVEYRLLTTQWYRANTSSVDCEIIRGTCELQVPLPCSDSHYELRVSIKIKTALEERFWSDPTSIFFFTDPNSSEVDPMCSVESKESAPLPSIEVILYKVRELIRLERKNEALLKQRIRDLKEKLALLKDHTRLIDLKDKKSN